MMNKKAEHAMDFAMYCTNWYCINNPNYGEPVWSDCPEGFIPAHSDEATILTTEQLYKRFRKEDAEYEPKNEEENEK